MKQLVKTLAAVARIVSVAANAPTPSTGGGEINVKKQTIVAKMGVVA